MITVFKYPIRVYSGREYYSLPKGAEILLVDSQAGNPCLWAKVDTNAPLDGRWFTVTGTGEEIPEGLKHVASFQQGPYVWHLWEDEEEEN